MKQDLSGFDWPHKSNGQSSSAKDGWLASCANINFDGLSLFFFFLIFFSLS